LPGRHAASQEVEDHSKNALRKSGILVAIRDEIHLPIEGLRDVL
jgi:hypothetical protein